MPAVAFLPFPIYLLAASWASLPTRLHRVAAAFALFLQYMLAEGTNCEVQVHHTLALATELFFPFLAQHATLNFRNGGFPVENGALGKLGHEQHPFALRKMADRIG